jgi:hypothetical protein
MKKITIISLLIFSIVSCKSQVLPLENAYVYIENQDVGIPDNINYVKDVNNLLDKFIGIWLGTHENKNFGEFSIFNAFFINDYTIIL